MILGIAIGDAFGADYEMQPRHIIAKHLHLSSYKGMNGRKEGVYTDDTQMSIAIIELLLSEKKFTKENLAEKFVECFKRDPHNGYASRFENLLNSINSGRELLTKISSGSIRNGAAMRSVPIGILRSLEDVVDYATINASVTHDSPKGITSSVCIAAAAHYIYHNLGEYRDIVDFCISACQNLDEESISYFDKIKHMDCFNPLLLFGKKDEDFGVPCNGMRTAGAVLYLVSKCRNNLEKTLAKSILLGGDTDSTASIACGIVAMNTDVQALPGFLFEQLENGPYGRDYLIDLGEELFNKYPSR